MVLYPADIMGDVARGANGLKTMLPLIEMRDDLIIVADQVEEPTSAQRPLNSRLDDTCLEVDFGVLRPEWGEAVYKIVRES